MGHRVCCGPSCSTKLPITPLCTTKFTVSLLQREHKQNNSKLWTSTSKEHHSISSSAFLPGSIPLNQIKTKKIHHLSHPPLQCFRYVFVACAKSSSACGHSRALPQATAAMVRSCASGSWRLPGAFGSSEAKNNKGRIAMDKCWICLKFMINVIMSLFKETILRTLDGHKPHKPQTRLSGWTLQGTNM